MKKLITLLFCCAFTAMLSGQAPEKISYQAVVRDAANNLVVNQSVGLRVSILQGSAAGAIVYSETHTSSTNGNGLLTAEIGTGTVSNGSMAGIDWANGPYFVKTEIDPAGGTNYTINQTSELLSVPYALHAHTADSVAGGVSETDPVYSGDPASSITNPDIANWNSKLSVEVDGSVSNEIQSLSISNDTIHLSAGGGSVKLPGGFDGQYSNLTGAPTTVSSFTNDAGYLTVEVDGSVTNEIQSLSLSNDTIQLSAGGGFVKLPPGFDGQYSNLTGAPTNVSSFTNDAGYLTVEVDGSVTNEIQALSISNDTIQLSAGGGFVKLPPGFDGQYSSLTGAPTTVSTFTNDAGYLTAEVDGSDTNEIQNLALSNDTLSLSGANSVYLGAVGTGSPWNIGNTSDLYYAAGNVKIGQTQNTTAYIAQLTVGDVGQAAIALGHAGNFNEVNSGKIIFTEDVNYTGGTCGFEFQLNGALNTLSMVSGCPLLSDTSIVFTRTGEVRIPERLRLGGGASANPTSTLDLVQAGALSNAQGVKFRTTSSATNYWNIGVDGAGNFGYMYNGALKGSINSSTGAYAAASDRTLKKNITPMSSVLDRVIQLKPTRYQYNDVENGDFSLGFIAQDVQSLFPEAVTVAGNDKLALFYDYFSVIAIKAIQEQNAIIQHQQQEMDELKVLLQKMEERLQKLEEQ